jgi:hypothetical protein
MLRLGPPLRVARRDIGAVTRSWKHPICRRQLPRRGASTLIQMFLTAWRNIVDGNKWLSRASVHEIVNRWPKPANVKPAARDRTLCARAHPSNQ